MFRGFLLAFSYNGPLTGTGFSFRDRHQEYNTQKYRTIGDGCYNGFEAIHTLDPSPPPEKMQYDEHIGCFDSSVCFHGGREW